MVAASGSAATAPTVDLSYDYSNLAYEQIVATGSVDLPFDGSGSELWFKFPVQVGTWYLYTSLSGGDGTYTRQIYVSLDPQEDGSTLTLAHTTTDNETFNPPLARWVYVRFVPQASASFFNETPTLDFQCYFGTPYLAAGTTTISATGANQIIARSTGSTTVTAKGSGRFGTVAGATGIYLPGRYSATDNLADAPDISNYGTILNGTADWTNRLATDEPSEPAQYHPYDVWQKFYMPGAGTYTFAHITTRHSNDVTVLNVYTGPAGATAPDLVFVGQAVSPGTVAYDSAGPGWLYLESAGSFGSRITFALLSWQSTITSFPYLLTTPIQSGVHVDGHLLIGDLGTPPLIQTQATVSATLSGASAPTFSDDMLKAPDLSNRGQVTSGVAGWSNADATNNRNEPLPELLPVWQKFLLKAPGGRVHFAHQGSQPNETRLDLYYSSLEHPTYRQILSLGNSSSSGTPTMEVDLAVGGDMWLLVESTVVGGQRSSRVYNTEWSLPAPDHSLHTTPIQTGVHIVGDLARNDLASGLIKTTTTIQSVLMASSGELVVSTDVRGATRVIATLILPIEIEIQLFGTALATRSPRDQRSQPSGPVAALTTNYV